MDSNIYFTALKTYDSDNKNGFSWNEYLEWTKLFHLEELVSLDGNLNKLVFIPDLNAPEEWGHIITDQGMVMFFFNSLEYVLDKVKDLDFFNLLAIIKEPNEVKADLDDTFDFIGYDLIEIGGDTSALTNGGGFDDTFLPADLNKYGLISKFDKAKRILKELPLNNPDQHHIDCYLYEVWRHKKTGRKTNKK